MVNREMVLDVLIKEYNMYKEEYAYNLQIGNNEYFNIVYGKLKAIKRVLQNLGFRRGIDFDSREAVKNVYGHDLPVYDELYIVKGE